MILHFGKWELRASFSSLHKWNHLKLHRYESYSHFVWGKLSVILDDLDYPIHEVCGECDSNEDSINRLGEDYLTHCSACGTIEGTTKYLSERELRAVQWPREWE